MIMPYFIRYFDKVHIKRYKKKKKELTIDSCTGLNRLWRALAFLTLWCYHFWPKLASFILNFCRRKRSFQWCPDQSNQPNGVWDMHKNALKVEWKTQSNISCRYTWLFYFKNCPSWRRFLGSFLTASNPSRRSITAAKRKEKEKKKRRRKKCKSRKA